MVASPKLLGRTLNVRVWSPAVITIPTKVAYHTRSNHAIISKRISARVNSPFIRLLLFSVNKTLPPVSVRRRRSCMSWLLVLLRLNSVKARAKHLIVRRPASKLTRFNTLMISIMVIASIPSNQTSNRFKRKSWRTAQSKERSLSTLIFSCTARAFTNTHRDLLSAVMVRIFVSRSLPVTFLSPSLAAIKILGWGVENSTPYWLIANCKRIAPRSPECPWRRPCLFLAWNQDWGDNGFFKILRGKNECGIESGIVAGLPKVNWATPPQIWTVSHSFLFFFVDKLARRSDPLESCTHVWTYPRHPRCCM